jgi:hypothetical protein
MDVPVFLHLSRLLSTDGGDDVGIPKQEYVGVSSDQNGQVFEGQEMREVLREDL